MGRDLNPYLGRAYLGDALATLVSSLGGGTPQTTYAENMGVMAMTGVFSTYNFIAAALIALVLGLCPKFGALIQVIPSPVLGGITLLLYGIITLMGIRIWMDAKVDFTRHKNLAVAGTSLIVATGLGVKGLTVAGMNVAGIALGTVLALFLNWILSIGNQE
jgi:xanthine/uracil permease